MRTKPHQIEPAVANGLTLKTVGGVTQWAAAGQFNPDAGRSPWLAPYGVRLRGVNINAKIYSPDVAAWGKMFGEWDAIWDSYIKPQIDTCASIGANAIRMMGAAPSVITGYCTQAQYLEGYERLVDYCAAQGIWVYACLSASQEWGGNSVASVMPIMEAQAIMLDAKPNVIAIDVCQEIGLTPGFITASSVHDAASQLVTPIRAVTSLPLTCSVTVTNNTTAGAAQFASTTVTDYNDLFDFFDYHPYYDTVSVADVATAANAAAAVGKVILLGEYAATDTAFQRYEAVANVTENTANLVGSFAWAATDRYPGTAPDFGLFTETFAPRTTLITAFQTIPDHVHSKHTGHHLHDEGTRLPSRSRINFVGAGVTAADDATNDTTTVTIPGPALTVQDENSNVSTSVTQIDFQGGGVTASAGTGEVVVTIPASSLVVKDEGSTLTSATAQIDFVGAGITAATSGANVTVTVPGAGVGAGELLMQDGVTAPPVPLENEARTDWLYQG